MSSRIWALLPLFLSLHARADYSPKTFEIGGSFQPQDVAFTQKLSTVRFEPNSEGLITNAYSLLARYNFDQTLFFELEHSETQFQINTYNTSVFSVRDSRISIDQTLFRGFSCKAGELERQRFCWGVELGSDAIPNLQFDDATHLVMSESHSYMVGPSILIQYPASSEIIIHGKAWTVLGLGGESTDRATIKSDWKFGAQAGADDTFDEHQTAGFAMDYYVRQSKIETPQATGPLTWNVISSAVVFHFNYMYSF